jgi:transcriptional regulator with XRE-family HTH domain
MQAFQLTPRTDLYTVGMKTGRPSKLERTPFGARLHAAREAAGFSQAQVATKLGITQAAYAFWERRKVALRPEQIEQVAEILSVTAEQLFDSTSPKRGTGPAGKLRQAFDRASKLPREQQKHVVRAVEDAIAGCEARRGRKVAA